MTRKEWDKVLERDYDKPVSIGRDHEREESIDPGDVVAVIYRYAECRNKEYSKRYQAYRGIITTINERGIQFECGKRLSYRSIYDISVPVKDNARHMAWLKTQSLKIQKWKERKER